jgi:hypothetical protein
VHTVSFKINSCWDAPPSMPSFGNPGIHVEPHLQIAVELARTAWAAPGGPTADLSSSLLQVMLGIDWGHSACQHICHAVCILQISPGRPPWDYACVFTSRQRIPECMSACLLLATCLLPGRVKRSATGTATAVASYGESCMTTSVCTYTSVVHVFFCVAWGLLPACIPPM